MQYRLTAIGVDVLARDVARVIIRHSRQIKPTPASLLMIGKLHLPLLVRCCRRMLELVGRLPGNARASPR